MSRYDFTASQFASPITYDDEPAGRSEAFGDTNENQYNVLSRRFGEEMQATDQNSCGTDP